MKVTGDCVESYTSESLGSSGAIRAVKEDFAVTSQCYLIKVKLNGNEGKISISWQGGIGTNAFYYSMINYD